MGTMPRGVYAQKKRVRFKKFLTFSSDTFQTGFLCFPPKKSPKVTIIHDYYGRKVDNEFLSINGSDFDIDPI